MSEDYAWLALITNEVLYQLSYAGALGHSRRDRRSVPSRPVEMIRRWPGR
jgi:hypothetical protein